jgi:hypothetical protein
MIDRKHFEACRLQQTPAVTLVEDVMMKAAIVEIIETTHAKLFESARTRVAREVMVREYIGKMAEVVFADTAFEVVQHRRDCGRRTAMIEGVPIEGEDEDERSPGFQYTLPFHQRLDRVSEVLQVMSRKYKIVACVGDLGEIGPFAEI